MPLPILPVVAPSSPSDLLRLFQRTSLHWAEQIAEPVELEIGTAFANTQLGHVLDANFIHAAALPPTMPPRAAVEIIEKHFAQLGAYCRRWDINASIGSARTQPLIESLANLGWRPQHSDVMRLQRAPARRIDPPPDLKIIPARASFRHARQIAAEQAAPWNPQAREEWIRAQMQRLDDPHWDCQLALKNGHAVGTAGVLSVGDLGRVENLFISPEQSQQDIALPLMQRAIDICTRSLFKHVFAQLDPWNASLAALFAEFGFVKIGQIIWLAMSKSSG